MSSVRAIAKRLNVSIATVSRALNNHPEINPETSAKVLKAANEIGYFSSVGRRITTNIGFVSSNNWDVNGAGSAGLTTFWIQRAAAEPPEELGYPAAHVVHVLTDLPALVR